VSPGEGAGLGDGVLGYLGDGILGYLGDGGGAASVGRRCDR